MGRDPLTKRQIRLEKLHAHLLTKVPYVDIQQRQMLQKAVEFFRTPPSSEWYFGKDDTTTEDEWNSKVKKGLSNESNTEELYTQTC